MNRVSLRGPLAATLLSLVLILLWDASGLDMAAARLFGTPTGFPWRDNHRLILWLHEVPRFASWAMVLGLFLAIRRPFWVLRRLDPRDRVQLAISVLAGVLAVSLIKTGSRTSCPWDMQVFGGVATHVSHWAWGVRDGGPGKCFPAGHASAAFAYLGGWFVFRRRDPAIAWRWLAAVVVIGLVLGIAQQMRGAHYMSHTMWTAWICWSIAFAIDFLVTRGRGTAPVSGGTGRDAASAGWPSSSGRSGNSDGPFARIGAWLARPRSPRSIILWLSLYLALAANWALWRELVHLGQTPGVYLRTIAVMVPLLMTGTVALLSLTAWSRWFKPVWIVLVLLAAAVQHYMLAYGMVMDPSMAANVLQTDVHEARDLLGWRMLANVLLVSVLPVWWLWRVPVVRMGLWANAWRNGALLLGCAAVAAGGIMAMNQQLAPLMRNNVHLRYMLNPLAAVYSAATVVARPLFVYTRKLVPMTAGAALGPSYANQGKPPLYVIVVGETARSDHFSLNGYARDTNPELARRDVLSYRNVHSCGTNTLASVPCMFSPLGKDAFESSKDDHENLLDVLQAAGLAVLWVDNQAGCKDVCVRVPNASAIDGLQPAAKAALCEAGECLDDALLLDLDARLAGLPKERRAKGVVLVMHMMGSHGPAYYKRSPPDAKAFVPECRTNALAECGHEQLINGYDNSIRYTDRVLGRTIDWLKAQSKNYDAGMFYVSDHGESLGEYGLFLHGLPYSIAPEEQKHVPLVAWFSEGLRQRARLSASCLKGDLDSPYTHDNLYHTTLAMMDVQTPTFKPALDMFGKCRGD